MIEANKQPFGTILGCAPGNVAAYSSDYESVLEVDYPSRKSFRSYYDGIYMGYKWQCVEFARRWLYVNFGYIFDDVAMAYDIFDLRNVRDVKNNALLPLEAFENGNKRHPEFGSILIWQEGGEFEDTGHVAIVTEASDTWIRVAEQNVNHQIWPNNRNYSRELSTTVSDDGEYWITCSFGDAQILGWMMQTDDKTFAEPTPNKDLSLFTIKNRHADNYHAEKKTWLNIANKDEQAFVQMMGGHYLASIPEDRSRYFMISRTAFERIEKATNELHGMFMHATDYVLEHDSLLQLFNLPDTIIPKIRQSWDNRLSEIITSRFDFALSPEGLKVYEYNCDSASCYMEAGKVQGKWAKHFGVDEGVDGGNGLFSELVKAWKKSRARNLVHILRDDDAEEKYHAYFMQAAIEAAGLKCKVVEQLESLQWANDGGVLDQDGDKVKWVWKTWAWETALDQIRDEREISNQRDNIYEPVCKPGCSLLLSDVLLHKDIMIFEPMWSLIPSNKAILPVLWALFPHHPLLLNSAFELNEELSVNGYVEKPIVGRCGSNIALYDHENAKMESTKGEFKNQPTIYQQLFLLPNIDEYYTQICTFTAAGIHAGTCIRADKSRIIKSESDCFPLRIVDDKLFLTL